MAPRVDRRLTVCAVALAAVAVAAPALAGQTRDQLSQSPPRDRDAGSQKQTGTAVVRGRIVAADTGRPISLATITASAPELIEPATISTNTRGRYELRNLPAGRYTLSVSRNGFVSLKFGQRRPLEQGRILRLLDGQIIDDVDVALPRMSVISGRIHDETGDPVAGAMVAARQSVFGVSGPPTFPVGAGSARTNARGQYRITGLVPGEYVLIAQAFETWKAGDQSMGYVTTFYPGVSSPGAARRIAVGVGQQFSNADFALVPGRMATINGTISDSSGRAVTGAMISLHQSTSDITRVRGAPMQSGAPGRFSIPDVLPGEYVLSVGVLPAPGSGAAPEVATLPLVVWDADLTVDLITSIGWSISGRVVVESSATSQLSPNRFTVAGMPAVVDVGPVRGLLMGPSTNRPIKNDWSFAIDRLFGPVRLQVRTPDGWTVRAIIVDGRDISGELLERRGGDELAGVQVVVTNRLAHVSGQVADSSGAATTEGTVILFAGRASKWFPNSPWVRAVRSDQRGQYEIIGVPPGEYLIAALDYVPDRIWNDAGYLESIRRYAQQVTLAEGESATLPLKVVAP